MSLNPAPLQEKISTIAGYFTQVWARWLSDFAIKFNNRIVWADYNHSGSTQSHTGGGNTYLLNDGLGAFSQGFNINTTAQLWDNDEFVFSNLSIGDFINIRIDTNITTSANNQELDFFLELASGSGSDYDLAINHSYYKAIGTYHVVFTAMIYIGNLETKNFPAKIRFESDDDATIQVNGWVIKVDIL